MDKIGYTEGGMSLLVNGEYRPCHKNMASLFVGNDDFQRAYCVAGTLVHMNRTGDAWYSENEYHIFDERIGRLSPEYIADLRVFLHKNRIERVILACDDDDMRNRLRKELGVRMIFEKETKKKNSSVLLREWFARNKAGTEDSLLKISGDCEEALKSNYVPARDCLVRLLEHYDMRMRRRVSTPVVRSKRAGYG